MKEIYQLIIEHRNNQVSMKAGEVAAVHALL